MVSCRFLIPSNILNSFSGFSEIHEFSNVSVFENTELGFSDDLDDNGFPLAKFFDVEILVNTEDEAKSIRKTLESEFIGSINSFKIKELKNEDWVELYTKELKPIICSNFYFYNASIQSPPTGCNLIPIKLNSALAFGSGHHQTTQGCLLNSEFLKEKGFHPKNILDMGCGTGILGICSLKLWKNAELLGIDIDPEAVRIARANYAANEVIAETRVSNNVSNLNKSFDLILCNILKQPLIDLSFGFFSLLSNGGSIITSGFITSQEDEVLGCYESLGFSVKNRIQIDEWLSIIFEKNVG